jgi:FKBP-type peptidyl-prolyl cis-trans isomerase
MLLDMAHLFQGRCYALACSTHSGKHQSQHYWRVACTWLFHHRVQVIPAWESIVRYMRPGAEYNIVVPPKLAYGDKGVCVDDGECLVPPNETLKFTITLDKVAISP